MQGVALPAGRLGWVFSNRVQFSIRAQERVFHRTLDGNDERKQPEQSESSISRKGPAMQLKVVRFVSRCACGFAAAVGFSSPVRPSKPSPYGVIPGRIGIRGRIGPGGVPSSGSIAQFNSSSYAYNPNVGSATQVGEIWDNGSGSLTIGGAAA